MVRFHILWWSLIFALAISSCSSETNQPPAETGQSPVVMPTERPDAYENFPTLIPTNSATVPVTWAGLNLTGRLVYVAASSGDNLASRIEVLNLATGEIRTLFATSKDDWIYYVTVSPDAKQLVMSYIPPSQGNTASSRALYIMPLDGSTPPRLLFPPPAAEDHYVQAEWSPDGKYIYCAHYNSNDPFDAQLNPAYDIFRMSYPNGQPEKIAEHAFWPRISSDSTRIAYVSIEPVSGRNELYVAKADGSNPQRLAFSGSGVPEIIDAPIFSPDGQSILFSAPPPLQAYQPDWLEKLMGIQIAKAHNIPSDWWSVPVSGGVPTRLTQLQTINLFASISQDKKHLASVGGEGIFVMDLDGSNLTQLIRDPGISGTVSWIP